MKITKILFGILLLFYACDHGIGPKEKQTGISGTIYYKNWPPVVELINLKLIVFKNFPPGNIINEVLSGEAIVYPEDLSTSLPINVDSTEFILEMDSGTYEYIVVAQQYGLDVYSNWRAVGHYDLTPLDSLPTEINVIEDELLQNLYIYVDFDSLPIQPF
jgi:hypothetical protein